MAQESDGVHRILPVNSDQTVVDRGKSFHSSGVGCLPSAGDLANKTAVNVLLFCCTTLTIIIRYTFIWPFMTDQNQNVDHINRLELNLLLFSISIEKEFPVLQS